MTGATLNKKGCVHVYDVPLRSLLPQSIFPGVLAEYHRLMSDKTPAFGDDWISGHTLYRLDWSAVACPVESAEASLYWMPVSLNGLWVAAERHVHRANAAAATSLLAHLGLRISRSKLATSRSCQSNMPLWLLRLPVSIVLHWLTEQPSWRAPSSQRRHAMFVASGPDAFIVPGGYPRAIGSNGRMATQLNWRSGPGFLAPFEPLSSKLLNSTMLLLCVIDRHFRRQMTLLRVLAFENHARA